jgi:hypothetical protein
VKYADGRHFQAGGVAQLRDGFDISRAVEVGNAPPQPTKNRVAFCVAPVYFSSGVEREQMDRTWELMPGTVVEVVGNDVMVLPQGYTSAVLLTGDAAAFVTKLWRGEKASPPEDDVVSALELAGIIRGQSAHLVSRRDALIATGVAAGATMTLLTLPTSAMASSRIPVEGVWGGTENIVSFFVLGYDFPDVGDSPAGSPAPSGLTFGEETYDVVSWRSSLTGAVDGDVILWQLSSSRYPFVQLASESETLTATFEWAGVSYIGTFDYVSFEN